jgi:predicted DNA-binding ribbon-helix-helix protein
MEAVVIIDELNIGPITTPEHPDPAEIRRYIRDDYGFYGFDTVFVEDATWKTLCDIAREQDCTVDELCLTIGNEFPDADFAQAARYYVLRYLAAKIPDGLALPPELRTLKELTDRRRVQ